VIECCPRRCTKKHEAKEEGVSELLLKEEVFAVVGAAMEVHRELGNGYLEAVYQEAMELELLARHVPFVAQAQLMTLYKGLPLRKRYVADFVCYDQVIVELKVAERLTKVDQSQLLNYLHTTGKRVGVLINFGSTVPLEWKRMVL
jgi:GxxExxY protein